MEQRLERIAEKLDQVDTKLEIQIETTKARNDMLNRMGQMLIALNTSVQGQSVILERNTKDIEYHIHRSDLLEENVRMLRDEVKPLTHSKAMMDGAFKMIGIIATFGGLLIGGLKLFF